MNFTPSSLERAYASYIIEHQFKAPSPFYISGRIAVPFLSTSGVDRTLLRAIWNLVDPQMQGSLTQESQLDLLLKLVALAQVGRCDLNMVQYCCTTIPTELPRFADLPIPTPAWLLSRYGSGIAIGVVPLSAGPTERLSVSDAFGDLEVMDVPLPSLEPTAVDTKCEPTTCPQPMDGYLEDIEKVTQAAAVFDHVTHTLPAMNEHEEFGGFEEAVAFDDPSLKQNYTNVSKLIAIGSLEQSTGVGVYHSASISNQKDFASDEPVVDTLAMEKLDSNDTSGEFGGFEEAAPRQIDYPFSMTHDSLGPNQDQPLPSFMESTSNAEQDDFGGFDQAVDLAAFKTIDTNDASGEFGGFEEATTRQIDYPLSMALDSLGPSQDQPLPSLMEFTSNAEHDDFGGIEQSVNIGQVPNNEMNDSSDDFGGFEMADPQQIGDHLSMAFDSLGPNQDQPLPPLGNFISEPVDEDYKGFEQSPDIGAVANVGIHYYSEGIGGFEDAATHQIDNSLPMALTSLDPAHDQPLPCLQEFTSKAENDDFGGFEQAAGIDAVTKVDMNDTSEDFGGFEEAADINAEMKIEMNDTSEDFGGFEQAAEMDAEMKVEMNDTIEDFGGFEATAPPQFNDKLSMALDSPGPIQDQPLPSFREFTTKTEINHSGGFDQAADISALEDLVMNHPSEEFGGSEVADPPQIEDALSRALDLLGSIQDKPLPSLAELTSVPDDVDFGGFERAVDPAALETHDLNDTSDDFGGFEEAAPPQIDDPLSLALDSLCLNQNQQSPSDGELTPEPVLDDCGRSEQAADTDVVTKVVIHDTTDDFCGFDEAYPRQSDDGLPMAIDSLGQQQGEPLSSLGDITSKAEINDFRGFDQDAAITTKEHIGMKDTSEEFGRFEAIVPPQNDDLLSMAPASLVDDPFASFAYLDDVSHRDLPPLSSYHFEPSTQEEHEDDFGDFETHVDGMAPDKGGHSVQAQIATSDSAGNDDDSVGNFETPAESASPAACGDEPDMTGFDSALTEQFMNVDKGDFMGISMQQQAPSPTSEFFDWSAPVSITPTTAGAAPAVPTEQPITVDDDFGDFHNFTSTGSSVSKRTDDFFAAFDENIEPQLNTTMDSPTFERTSTFTAETPPDSEDTRAVSIGQEISNPGHKLPTVTTANESKVTAEDVEGFAYFESAETEFSAFESDTTERQPQFQHGEVESATDTNQTESNLRSLKELRQKVRSLVHTFPEVFGRRREHGKLVDFGKTFDIGIKGETRNFSWAKCNDASKLAMANRCVEVMTRVSTTNVAANWTKALAIIRNELTMSLFLLEQCKESVAAQDHDQLRLPLQVMLRGLGEYVRVVRSIVASIGDLMCLDPSVEISRAVLNTTWNDLALLDDAIEVETMWAKLQRVSRELGLSPVTTLESVKEIRRSSRAIEGRPLCGLTLQRLSAVNDGTTKAQVQWEGEQFMACSANFWVNVVSPVIP